MADKLIIVESPAKANTIKNLIRNYIMRFSIGFLFMNEVYMPCKGQ